MGKTSALLTALVLTTVPAASWSAPPDSPAAARPGKPRAELKMRKLSAAYAEGQVTVTFTLENRGERKAVATQTWIASFKEPTKAGPQDVGFVATPPIRRGRSKTLTATFPADHIPSGDVQMLACADYGRAVKQHTTRNDCTRVTIVLPPETVVTYGVNDRAAGAVTGTSTRGYCVDFGGAFSSDGSSGFCTVRPGGTITLTAAPAPDFFLASWAAASGKTCAGSASGAQISFTSPATTQGCVAVFQHNP
jgi:CARDB protein/List-Bact-rpt repeat protein